MAQEDDVPPLQIHLDPATPIELTELTGALTAVAHQFEVYALEEGIAERARDARLLVSSVKPGSIDIGLYLDLATLGTLFAPFSPLKHAVEFAEKLKALFDRFKKKDTAGVTVRDCEDVGAIVAPVASHGGTQTINVHNGNVYNQIVVLTPQDAAEIQRIAAVRKAELQFPNADIRQRVSMLWDGLDTAKARREGKRNPDKGLIEEIDPKPRPVFFEDQFAYLKAQMLEGEENPYRKVYFVDVSVSRVEDKVVSYRIIGFHGTAEREDAA